MVKSAFLNALKPLIALMPEVPHPKGRVELTEKLGWTAGVLILFLVCCHVPLYGVTASSSSDPFYWMRVIIASNRGTLMELGTSPIITAGLILQLLSGTKIIEVDQSLKEERMLFNGATKLLAIIMAFIEAFAYVFSGMYGPVSEIGYSIAFALVAQLVFASVICILLDELLQRDYGLGSGSSLFIATNVCEQIVWRSFSPTTINYGGKGTEFEGAIIALFHLLLTRSDKTRALREAFFRSHAPNLTNLFATVLVFALVMYFQGIEYKINLTGPRGRQPYSIKLFYTSNMPIILMTAIISQVNIVSQFLYKRFSGNILVNFLGRWEEMEQGRGQAFPVGGLAYYMTPPNSFLEVVQDPFHTVFYVFFVLSLCAVLSRLWIEVSGSSVKDISKQIKDQQMKVVGTSDDSRVRDRLNKCIPIAAAFGGLCIGALSILADFLGAIGSGTGILLAVTIIYQFYEAYEQERRQQVVVK